MTCSSSNKTSIMSAESAGPSPTKVSSSTSEATASSRSARGGGTLERDPSRRFSRAPSAVAHLLRGKVLRLSVEGFRGPAQSGPRAKHPLPCLLCLCPRVPGARSQDIPSMDAQPFRRTVFFDLLQDLYRKGLGHGLRRDFGGLGGTEDQGARCFQALTDGLRRSLGVKPQGGIPPRP